MKERVVTAVRPKVFCIGLSRTGTTSLTKALHILGYKSVHYPLSIISCGREGCTLKVQAVEKFEALTDIPVSRFYKELDTAFPGSKFILTVRDEHGWVRSMRRLKSLYQFLRWFPKVEQLFFEVYGTRSFKDEAQLVRRFHEHEREVRVYFSGREQDLLILNVRDRDTWGRLCEFLDAPVPAGAFPWHNWGYSTTFKNVVNFFGVAV